MAELDPFDYGYTHSGPTYGHECLVVPAIRILRKIVALGRERRVFDLGCGNGFIAALLHDAGFKVSGVDPSQTGIAIANRAYPHLDLRVGSAYDDLASMFGRFPLVVSFEVIAHVSDPKHFAATVYDLLEPGGFAVISTPYHGYVKNLLVALTGKFDEKFDPLWQNRQINFWSPRTITALLEGAGFLLPQIERVGRIPILARSMLAVAQRS